MDRTVLIYDRIAAGGARARRSEDDWSSDSRCCSNVTTRSLSARVLCRYRLECPGHQFQKSAFSASIRAQQPKPLSWSEQHIEIFDDRPPAERFCRVSSPRRMFRFRSRRGEIDARRALPFRESSVLFSSSIKPPGRVDPRFGFCRSGFGPRRSHSTSRRTRLANRRFIVGLRLQRGIPLFKEIAVPSFGLEAPLGTAINSRYPRSHCFQKSPVMADDEKCVGFGL